MKTIIISNRLPVKVIRTKYGLEITDSEGGLATGLGSVYRSGDNIWIGWPGLEITDKEEQKFVEKELKKKNLIPLFLTDEEVKLFYEGFANEIIWPICHYRPSYSVFELQSWLFYKQVNKKFAHLLKEYIAPEDTVWVHDYHLMLLPKLIRNEHPELSIGYFQHIPFPSHEVFRLIPWRKELLEGMLGADLIGFHTQSDVTYFTNACTHILKANSYGNIIRNASRKVLVGSFPMGIDAEKFKTISEERKTRVRSYLLKRHLKHNKIILSIDRLDYSKGIIERIKAIENLLETYPEYREKITFIQLIVPSRDTVKQYKLLKDEIDRYVGEVNSKFANTNWKPIQYFYNSYPIEEVCALYAAADVCLVTPIRDGMNLVCKEFIMCNSHDDANGVLILSEMAGAAENMQETIIINPNNIQQITKAIHTALTMPKEEQRNVLNTLSEKTIKYDVKHWVDQFLGTLKAVKEKHKYPYKQEVTTKIKESFYTKYKQSKKRVFLLDYDGTLAAFKNLPEEATPSQALLELLDSLQAIPENQVVIVSGRKRQTMDKWFRNRGYMLYAEHGAWFLNENKEWHTFDLKQEWKVSVKRVMQNAVEKTDGSFIEEKSFSIAWHYRNSPIETARKSISELKEALLNLKEVRGNKLDILNGDKVVEVKFASINKGIASTSVIQLLKPDFILAIGDDDTDEAMFKALPNYALNIKVGDKSSVAKYYIEKQDQVLDFLRGFRNKVYSKSIETSEII